MIRHFSLFVAVVALCLAGIALAPGGGTLATRADSLGLPGDPKWGPDSRVNTSASSPPGAFKNPSLAVDPTNRNNALTGFTTSDTDGGTSGYSWSTDKGNTWTAGRFVGPWMGTEPMTPLGDAHVAFDGAGVGYYSSFAIGGNTNGYFVLTTTNGTQWSAPMPVAITDFSEYRSQSSFAVDPRLSGKYARSLYETWIETTNSNPYYLGVRMQYSRDGGATWSSEIQISDPGHEFSYAPSVVVASDGTVYVAFEEVDNYSIANPPKVYLDRSTDGGQTWGTDILVTGAAITQMGRPDYKNRELTLVGGETCNLMRINHFPAIAVSPTNPDTVYFAWNDGRWEAPADMCGEQGRHSDIAFSETTDGGQTWGPTVRVNDDPTGTPIDHFQPAIAVKPDGTIGISWYDRRYGPDIYHYDTAYSQSTNGGVTWSANSRVSDVSSDPDALPDFKGIDDVGARRAMAFGDDYALPVWVDTRGGYRQGDIYADSGPLGVGTPTTTGTPAASRTATRTTTPQVSATAPAATRTATATTVATGTVLSTETPSPCPINFSDVQSSDWFFDYVRCLYCRGAISGYGDNTFRPYNNTTRGQLCKIVVAGLDIAINTAGGPHFSDVDASNPFYSYIETAYNAGIISGYSDGTFRWGNNVTRGQLSKIVSSAAGWQTIDPAIATFSDVPVGSAFYSYVETAYCHGVISGYSDGTFHPESNATRAQISKIVCLAVRNETQCGEPGAGEQ